MKSPITTLYYGNPPPFERKPPKPSEGDRLYGEAKAKREALTATLTEALPPRPPRGTSPAGSSSWLPATAPGIPTVCCSKRT